MAHVEFQKTHKVTLGNASEQFATETKTGTRWSMKDAHHAALIIVIGAVTAAVTISIIQANAITGGTTKTISGKSVVLGTADANSIKILEVEASELDVANAYNAIAAKVVAGGAGAILGTALIRFPVRYPPEDVT